MEEFKEERYESCRAIGPRLCISEIMVCVWCKDIHLHMPSRNLLGVANRYCHDTIIHVHVHVHVCTCMCMYGDEAFGQSVWSTQLLIVTPASPTCTCCLALLAR